MNQFLWTQAELLCRIIIAGICGGIIGYERKNRNKEAGIRTHMIVALGASLIMIVSKYGFADILGEQGIALDPSRIAAQIVTGVGFLGAGMIFMRKNTISGLTTSAGIWATSAIGMSIGSGLYLLGIVTTVLIVVIQIILHGRLLKETYKDEISFLLKKDKNAVQDLQKQLESMHIEILNIEIKKHNEFYMVEIVVSLPENYHATEMLKLFQHCDYIEEVNI